MAGMSRRDRWIYGLHTWWGRYRNAAFNLSDIRNRPVRLLICLPSSPEEARKAAGVIPELVACLDAKVVFVVGEPRSVEFCDPVDGRITVVPLDRSARWWFGLPSFGIVDRLSEAELNLAVDLNPCAELLPAVLCQRIGARIRLCLDDPQRGRVFNVRVLLAEKHDEGGNGAEPGTIADPDRSDPTSAGTDRSSGDSPYVRMLRVVQAVARPASHPRF
ncbi:MAG: hypothetical protein OXH02_13935 [Gemmatimonadetes bacterium]|nr:hypothetical protein [Gemmatimonadota bacterium]